MILLDTHALVWLTEGNKRLGKTSLSLINKALKSKELFVSSVSFWEVAMLVEKERLQMSLSVELWRKELLNNGLQEISINGKIAIQSAILPNFHGDPADRMIVATAINTSLTLCTADEKILDWQSQLTRINAKI
ncbi:MAG: type II toxin-antitoxin system VapC family toxin [Cycloclasticus sp.]|nr:type II toxin-antitoxin system VapC family toxin [Cycloclasticus sp.]